MAMTFSLAKGTVTYPANNLQITSNFLLSEYFRSPVRHVNLGSQNSS